MVIRKFPDVSSADEFGLLAMGGDLELESLLLAYRNGIFPWPLSDSELLWFAPPERALLFLDSFHIPKSLEKKINNSVFEIGIDKSFYEVISACAEMTNRRRQKGTWITSRIIDGYLELHKAGYAHSVEAYAGGRLVGGLYGVAIGGMFAGESMFYRERDASKFCLCFLAQHLRERGARWIDCQQLSPLLSSFGAVELEREHFMELLAEELQRPLVLF